MSKLKGVKDMSAEVVKKTSETSEEVSQPVQVKLARTKRKLKHVGYGSFSPTVIMKDLSGTFVKVKRDEVLKHIDLGWTTVNRKTYKEAVRGGVAAAKSEVAVQTRKRKKK